MKMEKSENDMFIKFSSEVAVRKGDDGGIINTRVENHEKVASSGKKYKLRFEYTLTKKDLKNESQTESGFFRDGEIFATSGGKKKLYIKTPSNENAGYNSSQYKTDEHGYDLEDHEIPVGSIQKEYYGVWVSKADENSNGIFKNIDVGATSRKYSEIFCDHTTECKDNNLAGYKYSYKSEQGNLETWDESSRAADKKPGEAGAGDSGRGSSNQYSNIKTTHIDPLMNAIKDISGNGVDMNEVCGLRKIRNLDEEQKNRLRIYCSLIRDKQ